MEKRDAAEGETVKRENGGAVAVAGLDSGGGGATEEVGRGSRGKSSSHSYPAPEIFRW